MHVAIINEALPYPANAGNRIRTLNLMLRLSMRHAITYVCRSSADPKETAEATRFLEDQGIETIVVDDPAPAKSAPRLCAALARNLFSPLPYAVASHNSAAVRQRVRALEQESDIDLWQFEWLAYADALSGACPTPTVVMAHNIESLIWQRYVQAEHNPLKRWYLSKQWRRFSRIERRIFSGASRVVTVSEEDRALAQDHFGAREATVVDNGVDNDFFSAASGVRQPKRILFLGSLDWRPNLDAVRLLLDDIFPRVLAQEPSAQLSIIGRRPPETLVRRVRECRGVELKADVPDVRPYLASCGVMAVPLRVGGGSRLKILEALACGLPVVSTRIGCEGLRLTHERDIVVADSPKEVADRLIRCIRLPEQALRMAHRGQRIVREQYDWDVLADRLEQVWLECVAGKRVLQEA